jgi:drug/metabolite transporter (DMT)-like permease
MTKQFRGSIILLLATIIWGSAFASQSMAMDHIGPFTFQTIRCFMAIIVLLPSAWVYDRAQGKTDYIKNWTNKKLWKAGILCGIPLFLACNLQQLGLVDTGAGKSGFLTAMYIVIVPIIGLLRKKPFSALIPLSVLIAVIGLYFLTGTSGALVISDLLLLGCALMFAVQITFVDIFATDVDPIRLNTVQILVCAVLSAIVMFLTEQTTVESILTCSLPLLHTGVLSMGAAYTMQIVGQKDLEPSSASLIMSLESVFSLLFGWLLLNEQLSSAEWVGCLLIFAAVILSQINIKKKAPIK